VFVFPTEREAFCISIIEAMGCGLPIVTTRVEGVMDVVRSGIDALLVTAGDDDALASAIETALGGGPAVAAMSSAARERAVRAYSSPAVVTAYRELFAGVLK
jgi:glycosyltransferase involved in cell wall biosynthesis